MARVALRVSVLAVVLTLLLFAAGVLVVARDQRPLASFLAIIAAVLCILAFLPWFGRPRKHSPKLPRGFELVSHQARAYPKDPSVHGYEVKLRPKRRIRGLRYEVIGDAPILNANTTIERVVKGELRGWWGVDPMRLEGTSAIFEFASPELDRNFDLFVSINSTTPVTVLEVRRSKDRQPAFTSAQDLMPPGNPPSTEPWSTERGSELN